MIGLIAWGRFGQRGGERVTVPAPVTDPGAPWLYDYIREHAADLGSSFDVVQWPPTSKAQGGFGPGCDGYGVFDRRDLGAKNQQGGIPTRYGTLEQLMAAIAALEASGTRSYGDLVLHQMSGENGGPGAFEYLGADGRTKNGRGRTAPGWFRGGTGDHNPIPPFSQSDSVPVPADDFPFGRELVYENCSPAGASLMDAIDYTQWLTKRTGFSGYRFDDTKGTSPRAVRAIMTQGGEGLPFYSEYFDGNPANLNWWATSKPMNGRSGVEDFTLHWRIQAACNGFDARQLVAGGAGYWEWRPDLAVAFVDNPDTDTSPGQQVIFNKGLAYAYMLMLPCRAAMVYGKDYFPSSVWPGAYGLKPLIDNLCWISRMFAIGQHQVRWVDRDVYVATRDGNGGPLGWSGGLLTALNFNTLWPRTVTVDTPFGADKHLQEYTGKHHDIWTDGAGRATFTIPSNAYSAGKSYLCFAPAGVDRAFRNPARRVTQAFVGTSDLDVMPVRNGMQVLPQRLLCGPGALDVRLALERAAVGGEATVQLEVVDAAGARLCWATTGAGASALCSEKVTNPGWYAVRLIGNLLPAAGAGFELSCTYMGVS